MTIEEIKSVSIVQFLESQGYHHVYILKENYWYLSPFRTEASPSFNVSPKKNLWNDFGAGEGGNLINLVQKIPQFGITECLIQYKCSENTPPPYAIRSG